MDTCVLTKGRYRGKPYLEVWEKYPDYCKTVREASEKNEYCPVDPDFALYVMSKHRNHIESAKLCEQGSCHFVRAMTPAMRREFTDLVDNIKVDEGREVHSECQLGNTNGFLGVFYRYFIKKCVFNIRDEDGYNSYIDKYATIFPFKVNLERIYLDRILVLKSLYADERFRLRTRDFLNAHFDDAQFEDVVEPFLSNIYRFQLKSNMDVRQLENISRNESATRFIDGSGDRFGNFRQGKQHPYLKSFPRLNREGAKRFQNIYAAYEEVMACQMNGPVNHSSYHTSYFTSLPETNFYELFSLLESRFFKEDFETYTERFHKYLFFFVGASKSVQKPVFFIDDYLFECLKSLHKFKKSRLPATKIIHELRMITLVHRRKQACDRSKGASRREYEVDLAHLENVRSYIENFRGIETAKIEYEIANPDVLQCNALLCLDDTTVDVRFSKLRHGAKNEFWESFLMAALCDFPVIKRLVLYNAFLGREYTVDLDETFNRAGIRNFARKYNTWDFSTEIPFEKSLTWGWEQYFVEDTINWEDKEKKSSTIGRK